VNEAAPGVLDEKIGVREVIEKRAKGLRQRSAEETGGSESGMSDGYQTKSSRHKTKFACGAMFGS